MLTRLGLLMPTKNMFHLHPTHDSPQFAKSRTGVFFADIGFYDHAERTYELCTRGHKWTVDNVPIYYNQGIITAFCLFQVSTLTKEFWAFLLPKEESNI